MTTVYVQPGDVLSLTVDSDVKSNDVVRVGSLIGIATHDAKAGETCEVGLAGVWELPKGSGALAQGADAFWDGAKVAASGDLLIGAVTAAAGADAKLCRVRLNGVTV